MKNTPMDYDIVTKKLEESHVDTIGKASIRMIKKLVDDIEAARWYRLAADQGHDWARAKLNAIEDENLREDAARKAALLKEAEAQAAMEVQKQKQQVIVATYKACVILLSDDKVAALTNPLCHSLFLENGLPEGFQFE